MKTCTMKAAVQAAASDALIDPSGSDPAHLLYLSDVIDAAGFAAYVMSSRRVC